MKFQKLLINSRNMIHEKITRMIMKKVRSDTHNISSLHKAIFTKISQFLVIGKRDEIFDTIITSNNPAKQQLLYIEVTAITGG